MSENMVGPSEASPFFPSPEVTPPSPGEREPRPSMPDLDPAVLSAMSEDELAQAILEMLCHQQRQTLRELSADPPNTNRSVSLDSLTAVWVISKLEKAFDRRLIRLSEVDTDSLRSVGSVAHLMHQAIAATAQVGAA